MTSKNYYANNHIITCLDSATDVYIKPGPGKTLHIDGVVTNPSAQGIYESVQFNSLDDLAGDSSFLYDTINNVLTIPTVNTELVERIVSSNSLDYNEIYLGTSEPFPAVVGSTHTETNFNFGFDCQISPNENVIVYANPHYVLGGSSGGLDAFSLSGTVFSEYSLPLIASNFTLEQTANSGSISDDGGGSGNVYATLCDNSQVGYVYLFKRTSGVWAELSQNNDLVYHQAKITHIGSTMTMLSVDRLSAFSISEITSAGVFTAGVQTLYDGGNFSEAYRPIAIHQFWCLINADGNTMYYNKIGSTWTLVTTVTGAVNDLDVFTAGVQTAYVSVLAKSTGLTIKTFWGAQTFSGNYTACACTDAYVFGYNATSGAIEVYKVQPDQSFVKSVNDTIISGVNKMSCNYAYLSASQTSDNQATIFKIQDYVNHDVELIKVSLNSTSQKVEITSPAGVTISDDLVVSGVLSTTATAFLEPELKMSSGGSGLHYNSNTVSTLINYTSILDVGENIIQANKQILEIDGSSSNPAYSFVNDPDCGMFRASSNNISIAAGGSTKIQCAPGGNSLATVAMNSNLVSGNASGGSVLKIAGVGAQWSLECVNSSAGSSTYEVFYSNGGATAVGNIATSDGVTCSFNSLSSRLLKKEIVPVDNSEELSKVLLLKPCHFVWKSNNMAYSGFVADQVEEVFPQAVSGTDLPDENGQINYKSLDPSKMIYSLVGAIQELSRQNDLLREDIRSIREELATFV